MNPTAPALSRQELSRLCLNQANARFEASRSKIAKMSAEGRTRGLAKARAEFKSACASLGCALEQAEIQLGEDAYALPPVTATAPAPKAKKARVSK